MPSLKEFRRQYSAELLTHAPSDLLLGELYEWKGLFTRRLDPTGQNLIDHLDLDRATREDLRQRLAAVPAVPATFAQIDLKNDLQTNADLQLSNLPAPLAASLSVEKIQKFEFGGVVSRRLNGELRIELRQHLDRLKERNQQKYRQVLRHAQVADSVFYAGAVLIQLESTTSLSVEAEEALKKISGKAEFINAKTQQITFGQADCPFAAELVKGKDF
ncbi:MAG: hypothetical protein H7Z21_09465 [Hymenobacter sp.]|nr:hypothetical protein [Hymenobacter sp.]